MPEPLHPPYESGALTNPRQLLRWLDVNAQNGALGRTQTYIVIPAFEVTGNTGDYYRIVGEFHFSSPNNFSFRVADVVSPEDPDDLNYTLTVSYVNDDNTVVRYRLWSATNEILYDDNLPQYIGQLIKKEFRIEIWTDGVANLVVPETPAEPTTPSTNQVIIMFNPIIVESSDPSGPPQYPTEEYKWINRVTGVEFTWDPAAQAWI